MNITRDEWTPLFRHIKSKVSPSSRRILLAKMINDLLRVTKSNFGQTGPARPEPWSFLTPAYAKRVNRPFATLDLQTSKGKFNKGKFEKLKTSFLTDVGENKATLTNTSPYADVHQLGLNRNPRRPFYPVTVDDHLIPYASDRLQEIVEKHFQI